MRVAARPTPAELFDLVLRVFREHGLAAGRPLTLGTLADGFRSETAFDLEIALRYGISEGLIERAGGPGHPWVLTTDGERRSRQRPLERGQGHMLE